VGRTSQGTGQLLSQNQLTTIGEVLPAGATALGGLSPLEKTRPVSDDAGTSSVIVISANDDHTIHRMQMNEVEPGHYEIVSDTIVGTW
jgi:hypothetical protein